tara:strand:- start:445 stop:1017 length:573 start_codon:yes stop_codon:yes gene_type:complete
MIKILITLKLFLSFFLFSLYAQHNVNQMDIMDYLKSKYLGKRVFQRLDNGGGINLKIINIVEEDDYLYAVLSSLDKIKISFKTSLSMNPSLVKQHVTKKNHIDLSILKTEELINKGIQKTLSQSTSLDNTSSLSNFEKNVDQFKQRNDFTTSKKIIYTDIKSKKEFSDYFIVTYQGLYLLNGTKLIIDIK